MPRLPQHRHERHQAILPRDGITSWPCPHQLTRDPRNLWPERWGTPAQPLTARGPFPPHLVGAKSKDATENALRREVCAGILTLRQAQWIIATGWFEYFREKVLH